MLRPEPGSNSTTQVRATDPELNLQPFGARADALTREPHPPGSDYTYLILHFLVAILKK